MLYSSGTTGRPKGVKAPLTGDPLGTPDALTTLVTLVFGGNDADRSTSPPRRCTTPPRWRFCMAFLRIGATVVVMEHFDAEEALALIERHRVTHSQWVPTMFIRMLKLPEDERAPATTSARCRSPSTPPPRARSRSRSR